MTSSWVSEVCHYRFRGLSLRLYYSILSSLPSFPLPSYFSFPCSTSLLNLMNVFRVSRASRASELVFHSRSWPCSSCLLMFLFTFYSKTKRHSLKEVYPSTVHVSSCPRVVD